MVVCKYFQQGYCRYGKNCRFDHVYGSKYSYRANQNSGSQSNPTAFNSRSYSPQSYSSNAASTFRSAAEIPSNNQPMFGTPQHDILVFSRLGSANNSNAKSLFAQANQNAFSETNFQNSRQSDAKSLFSQASQNIFGQTRKVQHNPADVFAKASATYFAQVPNVPSVNSSSNVFQMLDKPSSIFGQVNNSFEQIIEDDCIYSKVEELSETDLEAFKGESFKLGSIPDLPPPRSLCV